MAKVTLGFPRRVPWSRQRLLCNPYRKSACITSTFQEMMNIKKVGLSSLITGEMRKRLRQMGKSVAGRRNLLKKRLSDYSQEEDGSKEGEGEAKGHASGSH